MLRNYEVVIGFICELIPYSSHAIVIILYSVVYFFHETGIVEVELFGLGEGLDFVCRESYEEFLIGQEQLNRSGSTERSSMAGLIRKIISF